MIISKSNFEVVLMAKQAIVAALLYCRLADEKLCQGSQANQTQTLYWSRIRNLGFRANDLINAN
jgi:hypothetical protein